MVIHNNDDSSKEQQGGLSDTGIVETLFNVSSRFYAGIDNNQYLLRTDECF